MVHLTKPEKSEGMPMLRPTRPPVRGSSVVAGNSTRGSIRGFKRPLKGQVGLTREDVSQRNLIAARGAPMRGQVRPQNLNVAQRAKAPTVRSTSPGVSPHARRVPAVGTTTGQSAIAGQSNSTNDMWSSLVTVDTSDRLHSSQFILDYLKHTTAKLFEFERTLKNIRIALLKSA